MVGKSGLMGAITGVLSFSAGSNQAGFKMAEKAAGGPLFCLKWRKAAVFPETFKSRLNCSKRPVIRKSKTSLIGEPADISERTSDMVCGHGFLVIRTFLILGQKICARFYMNFSKNRLLPASRHYNNFPIDDRLATQITVSLSA